MYSTYWLPYTVYISCLKWIETLCIIQNNTKTMRKQWLNKWKCNAKATEILSRKLKLEKKNAKIYPLNDYLHQKIGYKNINWQAFTKHTESYGIHTARMAAAFLRSTRTRIKAHTQKRIAFQILCALNRLVFFCCCKSEYIDVFFRSILYAYIFTTHRYLSFTIQKNTLFPNLSS